MGLGGGFEEEEEEEEDEEDEEDEEEDEEAFQVDGTAGVKVDEGCGSFSPWKKSVGRERSKSLFLVSK